MKIKAENAFFTLFLHQIHLVTGENRSLMFRKTLFIYILLILFIFITGSLQAEETKNIEPRFTDSILTTSDSHLLFFTTLQNSFTEEMILGVKSGIPIQFSFFITLEGVKENWPDQELLSIEFKHTLTYDTLKEIYNVELEEKNHQIISSEYLSETQKIMGELNGIELTGLNNLDADTTYKLRFRAVLYKKTLPMGLHKVTPFISWWDVETQWQELTFTY